MNPQSNSGQDQGRNQDQSGSQSQSSQNQGSQSQSSQNQGPQSQGGSQGRTQGQGQTAQGRGLSDLAYNLVTMLAKKAKAAEVYDQYLEDARAANSQDCVRLIQQIQQDDLRHIEELKGHVIAALSGGQMPSAKGPSGAQDDESFKARGQGRH
jgi:hypothetical protein